MQDSAVFLHGSVAPLARMVERELSTKLGSTVTLGFDSLFASDVTGRARAVQSLVGAGVELDVAMEAVRFMVD